MAWIGLADVLITASMVFVPVIVVVMPAIALIEKVYVVQLIDQEGAQLRIIAPRSAESVSMST